MFLAIIMTGICKEPYDGTAPATVLGSEKGTVSRVISRLTAFSALAENEMKDLAQMIGRARTLDRGETIWREGDEIDGLQLLLSGWSKSSVGFASGAEHVLNIHMAGDLLGTADLAMSTRSETMVTVTKVDIAFIARQQIGDLFGRNPRLAAILFLISQEERVTLMDRLASHGASDASSRLASMLLHFHARAVRGGIEENGSFDLPLAQAVVAGLIGLSKVHLNRTLQTLRAADLVRWERQRVTVVDQEGLARVSGLPRRPLGEAFNWLPPPRTTEHVER